MKSKEVKENDVAEDLSGKDRVVKNVITSWGSHLIIIIIGFIMPRMINDHLGQVSLGIWDLSWSFVNYLSLTGFGVGSSVNRYVAKYRSQNDYQALNRSLSSVVFIQFLIALSVVIGTVVLVWLIPELISDHEGVDLYQVKWVVGLLGLSLAMQMTFDTSRGLLTGMHRWDLYNTINATAHILNAILMVIVIMMGGNLIGLATVYFLVTSSAELLRSILATRLCKGLNLKKEFINVADIKKMFKYGAKTIITSSPGVFAVQTINIFVASSLGPGALAVFARPFALVRHVETFLNKYSFVLTPMVGSIAASKDQAVLKEFLITSTRYSVAFSLPILLFIGVLGDHILNIWMGEEYAHLDIILILSLGYFLPISQGPSLRVLMGMNRHGKVAILNLILTVVMLLIGLAVLNYYGWDLRYVALLIGMIFTTTFGIITPVFTCHAVGIKYYEYLIKSFGTPILCGLALFTWLLACRQIEQHTSVVVVLIAALGSSILMSGLYWFFILPESYKKNIKKRFQ
jgi:O-antigen/teichoic acid export membrane protein